MCDIIELKHLENMKGIFKQQRSNITLIEHLKFFGTFEDLDNIRCDHFINFNICILSEKRYSNHINDINKQRNEYLKKDIYVMGRNINPRSYRPKLPNISANILDNNIIEKMFNVLYENKATINIYIGKSVFDLSLEQNFNINALLSEDDKTYNMDICVKLNEEIEEIINYLNKNYNIKCIKLSQMEINVLKKQFVDRLIYRHYQELAISIAEAVQDGDYNYVKVTLDNNPDFDINEEFTIGRKFDWTILHYACYYKQEDIVQLILEKKPNIKKTVGINFGNAYYNDWKALDILEFCSWHCGFCDDITDVNGRILQLLKDYNMKTYKIEYNEGWFGRLNRIK